VIVVVLTIAGVIILLSSVCAWYRNTRLEAQSLPARWVRLWRWRWAIGAALGVSSVFMRYPLQGNDGQYLIHGIPFFAYAFDQDGLDYLSPFTMPFMLLNFVTWLYLPQLMLSLVTRRLGATSTRS
jgi:hypothetical protein